MTGARRQGNIDRMPRPPPRRNVVILGILLVTVAVFFHQASLAPLPRILFNEQFGAVPSTMWSAWHAFRETGLTRDVAAAALPLLTANYLHADVGHIVGNLIFFWIFAHAVSRSVGPSLLLVIYVVAGAIAVLVHVHANPDADGPMLGASGAIAGLEGAYFTLVLRWEVPAVRVWPLAGAVPPGRLAFLAIANFVLDTGSFVGHAGERIAYGAHVGGFLGGALVAMVISTVWTPRWRDA